MNRISVWFVCQLCRSSYQQVSDLINHKFESHFEQFKSVKSIIFEERCYHDDSNFPDGDHVTKSNKQFDKGQVDWDRYRCVNTIQIPPLPRNNSTRIKHEDAAFQDKKPFAFSSNSDPLDNNIDRRTVSFTIEQDSVTINVGSLNDINSAALNPEHIAQPFDTIGKEKQVCNAAARIQNPFVLLKRLSPQGIKNAKLPNKTVTKFNQNCSGFDAVSHTDSIALDVDQLCVTSQTAGTSSDCKIDAELDVKPFKLNEENTLSNQNRSTGTRRKCEKLFQHNSQTFISSDEGNSDSSAPVLAATPENCTINSGENQLTQNIDKIIHSNSAKNSLRLEKESAIFSQKQFTCPRPNCKMSFKKEAYLIKHINYYHGDLERRRLIASGCHTYGSNNDKMDMDTLSESRSTSVHPVSDIHSDCNIEKTKTSESMDSEEDQLDLKIKQIIREIYAETALREEQKRTLVKQTLLQKRTTVKQTPLQKRTIVKQTPLQKKRAIVKKTPLPFACPRQKCKSVFKNITSVKSHLDYFHGDLERRRLIASGCQTYGSNDDDKNADCGTSELAAAVIRNGN